MTGWPALCEPHGKEIDRLTECVSDYFNFCVDATVPTRIVKRNPNNKPWATKDIKALLNKKRARQRWRQGGGENDSEETEENY